jgi:F-type H+-transporting ATPase subunit delta
MSELVTLARPYAEAAFKRAQETDTLAKWSDSLNFLSAVMQDKDISVIIDNPKIAHEQIKGLLLEICEGQLSTEAENFVKLLIQNKRLSLAHQIALLFEQFRAEFEGYIDVNVTSAFSFSAEEQKKFTATLEKQLNKKVRAKVTVDKSLLGGVIVRAGDRVIDGSVKGQLQQLAKRL